MGDTGDTGLVIVVVAVVLLFAFVLWPAWSSRTGSVWTINASVSPVDSGSVSPAGNNTVQVNQSIIFNALDNENFSFQNWIFDGVDFGTQPQISIPSQIVNSTHRLIAVFQPKSLTFSISPTIYATRNTNSNSKLVLSYVSNVELTNLKLKLNDPYGVFSSAFVSYCWYPVSGGFVFGQDNCLNSFQNHRLFMQSPPSYQWATTDGTYNLVPNSDAAFMFFYIVSNNIQSGTYHLNWELTFSAVNGSLNLPPHLIIPWSITVVG